MRYLWLLPLLVLAACGIPATELEREPGDPPLAGANVASYNVYLIKDGRLSPVPRRSYAGKPLFAFNQLQLGPTEEEKKAGFRTEVPQIRLRLDWIPDAAVVHHSDPHAWSKLAKAQIACTLERSLTGDPKLAIKPPDPAAREIPIKCEV